MRKILSILAVISFFTFARTAQAADGCGDILRGGVFDSVDIQSRTEFYEIVVSRFISSTYESSQDKSAGINGKSIGELVMGGSAYGRSDYELKKGFLQKSYTHVLSNVEDWTLATRTANPNIVAAWQKCQEAESGLYARFETTAGAGKDITLILEFKGAVGINSARVSESTYIPKGVELLSKGQFKKCLARGAIVNANAPCRVLFRAPADMAFKVVVSSNRGDAEAQILKRLRWQVTSQPFIRSQGAGVGKNASGSTTFVASIAADDINAGYTFVPRTISVDGPNRTYGSGDARCNNIRKTIGVTSVIVTYDLSATDNMSLNCSVTVSGTMEKGEFVTDE